jgi:hypothetical protein
MTDEVAPEPLEERVGLRGREAGPAAEGEAVHLDSH